MSGCCQILPDTFFPPKLLENHRIPEVTSSSSSDDVVINKPPSILSYLSSFTMMDGATLREGTALGKHPDGLQFDDVYTLLQRLGSGSFGEVYTTQLKDKAQDPHQYACKVIDRSKLKKDSDVTVFRELAILRDIRDLDHVTQLKDCFVTPTHIHIVQTLCHGGDVFEQLSKRAQYTERDARDLASTLFKVMELLHLRRLAHRDLKPENLLLRNRMCASQVVVGDFGMAQYVPKDGFLSTRCGTPAFVAPEVIAGRPYTTQVDMWSIGTLLFMLLGGRPPFADQTFQGLFRKIQAADYDFSHKAWKQVSIPAKQCLAALLRVDPYYRATASQALQCNWFTQTSDDQLQSHDLTGSVKELKTWIAKRRFKSAVHAVRLTSHFSRFVAKDQASLLQKVQAWDNQQTDTDNPTPPASPKPLLSQWKGKTQNFSDLYELQEEIARGHHSTVYKCVKKPRSKKALAAESKNDNPTFLAVKRIPRNHKQTDSEQAVLHEVAVMQNLKHAGMVQIVDFLEDSKYYYVILEHVPGKTVLEHLQVQQHSFTELEARAIMEPLLQVIAYIHGEGVVHRDVTLENVILTTASLNGSSKRASTTAKKEDRKFAIKLCDFGLARRVPAPRSVTRCCGTPLYMAPEVVKHIPYDQSADMWSVGVLLYMLLVGMPPFAAKTEKELFERIKYGGWSFPANTEISDAAQELVKKLLVVEPLGRWTAEEALRSKWFQEDASSLSSIDLSKNVSKLKDLKSKFKSVAKVVMKLTPNPTSQCTKPMLSASSSEGFVVDENGIMMGKEVDLATFQKTATELFDQDPEQKVDDPTSKMNNEALGLPTNQEESQKHVV